MKNYSYIRAIILLILSIIFGCYLSYVITAYNISICTVILAIFSIILYFRIFILLAIKKNKEEKLLLPQFIFLILAVYSVLIMYYWNFDNKYEIALCVISELSFIVFFTLNVIRLKVTDKI